VRDEAHIRVVSWNLAYRVGTAATRQGELLAELGPDLALLQEVNRRSIEAVCTSAGLMWWRCAVDVRVAQPDDSPVRRRGVAIAGRGNPPISVSIRDDVPLPERILVANAEVAGDPVVLASYHAPPGVNWLEKKPQQAVAFAQWLATVENPTVFGADANTPLIDAIDFAETRTHWHTGRRRLRGAPGDDLLFGPAKLHGLEDALRRWLALQPDRMAEVRAAQPLGPLAVSHRTGKRRASPGTGRRFDSLWVSPHFDVLHVDYPYKASVAAGSDHSAVVADLRLRTTPDHYPGSVR
jgi:endonuclease/exonuclease/phosphatase family metal-dependent hydrolase